MVTSLGFVDGRIILHSSRAWTHCLSTSFPVRISAAVQWHFLILLCTL